MDKLIASLKSLNKRKIKVGIFDERIVEYALKQEFGTETIPQRSFIRSAIFEEEHNLSRVFADAFKETKDLNEAQRAMGEYLVEKIKDKIRSGDFVPNSPVTIKKKGKDTPLIDSGAMLNSIEMRYE